ncbi:MAG TPA: DUF4192 domain-containing protein [Micromonosporaceae bacterium]|nr:DUF4192 domain-containing protein [Micromonosporaceae bacterium]
MPSVTPQSTKLRLRSASDLLAAVPYLIGFHPSDSLVLVGFGDRIVRFLARADLPEPDDPGQVRQLTEVAGRQMIDEAALIGYGPPDQVDPAILELCVALEEAGLPVREALRVTGDRYWSYLCQDPDCCPPEGQPFQVASSPIAASAVVAGCVALPDRTALEQQLEPIGGVEREMFAAATVHADRRIRKALTSTDLTSTDQVSARGRLVRGGGLLLDRILDRYPDGNRLADPTAAWLSVLLLVDEFVNLAWERVVAATASAHVALWSDLTRRAERAYLPRVATLLGYAAWRTGDGALAGIAIQRALGIDPDYPPANVMDALLMTGTSPDAVEVGP